MLKKQTIWLLTMLSLMIVLSIVYMTSDSEDLAYIDDGTNETQETSQTEDAADDSDVEVDDVTNLGKDELFTTIRMNLQDERNMKKDRLNEVVAASNSTSEEKNDALNDINDLEQVSTKESIIEESIMSQAEYQDVLVRSDEDIVHVHVKVDELSNKEANNIMQMVRDEFGDDLKVDVNFQPTEE